jgi:hypothetical protein
MEDGLNFKHFNFEGSLQFELFVELFVVVGGEGIVLEVLLFGRFLDEYEEVIVAGGDAGHDPVEYGAEEDLESFLFEFLYSFAHSLAECSPGFDVPAEGVAVAAYFV